MRNSSILRPLIVRRSPTVHAIAVGAPLLTASASPAPARGWNCERPARVRVVQCQSSARLQARGPRTALTVHRFAGAGGQPRDDGLAAGDRAAQLHARYRPRSISVAASVLGGGSSASACKTSRRTSTGATGQRAATHQRRSSREGPGSPSRLRSRTPACGHSPALSGQRPSARGHSGAGRGGVRLGQVRDAPLGCEGPLGRVRLRAASSLLGRTGLPAAGVSIPLSRHLWPDTSVFSSASNVEQVRSALPWRPRSGLCDRTRHR